MSPSEIAGKWFEAFNRQSIDDLLKLYDEAAEHFSPRLLKNQPATKGLIKGHAAMRDWWQGSFDRMPSLRYKPTQIKEDNDIVYLTYTRSVDGEADQLVNEYLQIKNAKIIFSKVM